MLKSNRLLLGLILFFLVLFGAFFWTNLAKSENLYAVIEENFTAIKAIYQNVFKSYVDEIDTDEFLKAAIDGMLSTLDPYTTYIEKEDKTQLEIITHGNYGGVGMPLNFRNKVVTVADPPFVGTPSYRAGIRAGDQIINVDSIGTRELGFAETVQKIRGPAGTEVVLTIRREGESDLLTFKLIREIIEVPVIRYSGLIDEKIGYIRLIQFSKNAGEGIEKAIQELKQQGMTELILDLRSNPGGLLETAVEVSDLFLPKGLMVVSSRGRNKKSENYFKSMRDPLYKNSPLVVLVNEGSASASEIVSGAIQDHDRGIVIGDTTFGKGLVQSVVPITKNSALKITTAKYFTPSGRCIQKHNYSNWSDSSDYNEQAYFTGRGRPVSGGGGIIPDIVVEQSVISNYVLDLARKSHYFNFAVHYASLYPDMDYHVKVDDQVLQEFRLYLKEQNYTYQHPIEKELSIFKKEASHKKYNQRLIENIQTLEESLDEIKENLLSENREDILKILRLELASKLHGTEREEEIRIENDPVILKALEIIKDQNLYAGILNIQ